MDRVTVQKLVYSIVQFLRQQVETSSTPNSILKEEGAESVEVALQCLEAAYCIPQEASELEISQPLYKIFCDASGNEVDSAVPNFTEADISAEDREIAEQLKNEGNQLMREGKFAEAFDCYTRAIGKDCTNAVYYSNRAAAHSKLNNYYEAIEDCKRALRMEPQYSKAYGRMGLAYSELDDNQQAKKCYQKALELEPDNESYRSNLQVAEEKLQSQNQQNSGTNEGRGSINLGPFASMAGLDGLGTPNVAGLLNNPNLVNMATQLMSDPNMQSMLSSLLGGFSGASGSTNARSSPNESTPPPQPTPSAPPTTSEANNAGGGQASGGSGMNMDFLLNAGRQLAEQLEAQNPQLVEQLRTQVGRSMQPRRDGSDGGDQNPPES